jgi:hypothetical protein
MKNWKCFFCCISVMISSPIFAQDLIVKAGAGLGIPYGILGVGAEVGMPYISVLGGVGTAINGTGWSVGARAYVLPPGNYWRPHATLVYGTTATYDITVINGSVTTDNTGVLKGLGIYLGVDQDIGRPGGSVMTYGVGYITHESLPAGVIPPGYSESDVDYGWPIKLMVAWNWQFGSAGK